MPTLAATLWLTACAPQIPVPAPVPEDLSHEGVPYGKGGAAPAQPAGACWGHDTIPAVIETVTETVLSKPELRDATGKVIRPASYDSFAHQRMLHDRETVWLQTTCPADLTPDTIATLQRALKARGYFTAPLTGVMDAPTLVAVRRYQADHGLDTPVLTLQAARTLGLVPVDRSTLQ
jgi:hypothetical protein